MGRKSRITPKRVALLELIRSRIEETGWAPSLREMCRHFGWVASGTALFHLKALERHGLIARCPGAVRAIRVLADAPRQEEPEPSQLRSMTLVMWKLMELFPEGHPHTGLMAEVAYSIGRGPISPELRRRVEVAVAQ